MNKKTSRKGFTIVELIIVIAVIAILATVLIPTFSGMIDRTNASAALQEAHNTYTNLLIADADGNIAVENEVDAYINVGEYWFSVDDGQLAQCNASVKDVCVENAPAATNADQEVYVKSSVAVKDGAAYIYELVEAAG